MEYTVKTINELCKKITDGSHFSPEHDGDGEYQMYSVKDMEYNGFSDDNCKIIGKDIFHKLLKSDCRPLKNDILIAKDGSYLKYAFKVKEDLNACILSSIAILRPNVKKIYPDYFVYLMRSKSIKSAMANYVSGSALPRIILSDFKKMKLQIISNIATQQKIANILSRYDEAIENNNKRIKLLEQMSQNLYKEWFVRFRFPGWETCEFENGIPVGWERNKISCFYETSSGGTPSRDNINFYENGTIPWIKTGELQDSIIIDTDEKITDLALKKSSAKIINKDSILMAMYGVNIGMLAYTTMESTCNQACCAFKDKKDFSTKHYLFHYLKSIREYLLIIGFGAAQQNISQDLIKNIKILMPTDNILKDFEEKIDLIYKESINLLTTNQNLAKQRDLLLPRLMSGKLEEKKR